MFDFSSDQKIGSILGFKNKNTSKNQSIWMNRTEPGITIKNVQAFEMAIDLIEYNRRFWADRMHVS